MFQLVLSGGGRQQWAEFAARARPADLAMNVVLPEFDGRIMAGAISFKGETERSDALEFTVWSILRTPAALPLPPILR